MTVPRHGSTTESAVPGPTGRPASCWANDEGEFDLVAQGLSAANARRAAKSAAQVEQPSQPRCEPWRLPCRPCMSCHGRPARRVIRAKRAVIGRGDGATGVTMRAWSLGQRLNLAAPRSDWANTTSRNWQRGHPSLAWSLSRLGSPHSPPPVLGLLLGVWISAEFVPVAREIGTRTIFGRQLRQSSC